MPEAVIPADFAKLDLKDNAQPLAAIPVCRTCLVTKGLKSKPHKEYAEERLCSVVGCENTTAYLALLTPYEFNH